VWMAVHPVRFHSRTFHKQLLRPTRHQLRPLYCLQTNKRQSYTVYSTIFSPYCIYFSKVFLNSFLEKIQSIRTYNVHAKKICTISLNQSPEARVGLLDGCTVPKDWGNWITLKNIPWTNRFFPLIVLENMCTAINFKFCSH
jgi:hypothetical protein